MAYIHFTDEQKERANAVDLADFLQRQGESLLRSGRELRLESDHSITVRGNQWYDHAAEEGGLAIDFVQYHYGLSFPEAVTLLLGGEQGVTYQPAQPKAAEPPKPFALPPAHTDMRRVFAYLMKQRGIDREIVSTFAHEKLLYESAEPSKDGNSVYHNAVFVGYDEHGVARHAHKRSLNSTGKSYRLNVEGSDPRFSFHRVGASDRLYAFEAPIDLLSYLTLYPEDWRQHSYISLCGTSAHALLWMLEQHPHLQTPVLCLDNDAAGQLATDRLISALQERGYSAQAELPQHKDWNDELVAEQKQPGMLLSFG